ncbi:unnamed protein product [Urochloa humidicola]
MARTEGVHVHGHEAALDDDEVLDRSVHLLFCCCATTIPRSSWWGTGGLGLVARSRGLGEGRDRSKLATEEWGAAA